MTTAKGGFLKYYDWNIQCTFAYENGIIICFVIQIAGAASRIFLSPLVTSLDTEVSATCMHASIYVKPKIIITNCNVIRTDT